MNKSMAIRGKRKLLFWLHTRACKYNLSAPRYGISLRLFNLISHERAYYTYDDDFPKICDHFSNII